MTRKLKSKEELEKEALAIIRKELPKGWANILAEQFDQEPTSIKNVMYGTNKNEDVVNGALELAEKTKLLKRLRKERIKKLAQ
mgnify:CR=1 FL=1